MKKFLLPLIIMVLMSGSIFANTLTVVNLTDCEYQISTQGSYLTIPPNNVNNPVSHNIDPDTITGAKIICSGVPGQVNVGGQLIPGTTQVESSATVGSFPPCNNNNPFTVIWVVNAVGDISLVIH